MKAEDALEKIDEAVEKNVGDKRGYFSQRIGYRKSLQAVEELAGPDAVDDVASWIVKRIESGRKPENGKVRKKAFASCANRSVEIPEDSFLWT